MNIFKSAAYISIGQAITDIDDAIICITGSIAKGETHPLVNELMEVRMKLKECKGKAKKEIEEEEPCQR